MLSSYEKELIRKAAERIESGLPVYPGNHTLCKTAACNEHKLIAGFASIFGVTPYGYYTKLRLEKAKELLSEGRMTVSAVAYELEYAWAPSFIAAFKKAFGCTPGNYAANANRGTGAGQ